LIINLAADQGETMRLLVMTAVLALALCFKAEAQNNYMIAGWGPQSCAAWTKIQAGEPRDVDAPRQWVLGFVSAFNAYESPTGDVTKTADTNGLFAWIDNYCAAHPLDKISTATMALISELSQRTNQ
jgi:hypothetical protein